MSEVAHAPASSDTARPLAWLRVATLVLTVGYLISAAALLIWAGWKRFQLPQEPIIDPDIVGYLGPAISTLAGKAFSHMIGRSFPYPAFVYLVLRVFGDFCAISVVQHILGLAAGALILLAWNAAGDLVPPGGIPKALYSYMGLVPAYVWLGSATSISFEQQIRPEGIFPFLAILNIWLSFRFLDARFIRPRVSYLWLGAVNVFVTFLMYLAKPSFGFGTVLCTLPVWISLVVPGLSLREKGTLAAAAILPGVLLLLLPEHILKKSDSWSVIFLPETLLSAHAVLIEQQMTEDLAGTAPLPFPRQMVQAAHDLLGAELKKAPQITGPQADALSSYKPDYLLLEYLQYGDSFCVKFPKEMNFDAHQMANFCMTYYRRALFHHPGGMAKKALGQLALFYTAKNPAYWSGKSMDLSGIQYARVASLMELPAALGPGNPIVTRYIESCNRLAGEGIAITQARRFQEWLRFFSMHYLDLLAVALLSPLLLLVPALRRHFLWLIAALWLAYSYNFGNCLTIAVVHSMEVNRYVRVQLIFTIFAQCLSLYLLFELAAVGIRAGIARIVPRRETPR